MMMVRRGQADVIGIIGIMWMGKARVTGAESRRMSDGVGGTTEMHMNGRHRVRVRQGELTRDGAVLGLGRYFTCTQHLL
jgi:hypothetical protein